MLEHMSASLRLRRGLRVAVAGMVLAALTACATTQYDQPVAYNVPRPNTTVYAYPMHHQSSERQSRDRYECSVWAVHQTGFDPSAPDVPVYDRVAVQGPPPGTDTALGAIAGAVIGAALSDRWDRGSGAVFGALTGAMIGSAGDAANAQANDQAMNSAAREQARAMAHKAMDYRRALSACLQARGYSVR
jgi:uncharacterized protein YcfJ